MPGDPVHVLRGQSLQRTPHVGCEFAARDVVGDAWTGGASGTRRARSLVAAVAVPRGARGTCATADGAAVLTTRSTAVLPTIVALPTVRTRFALLAPGPAARVAGGWTVAVGSGTAVAAHPAVLTTRSPVITTEPAILTTRSP
ncbi:hypothetical protein MO973_37670, partial [Paenibacillus sp. TRM 82003]|nr:hypothetical protein [Paenibacillus sp. TRM 82003]